MPLNTFLHTYTPFHSHIHPPLPTIVHTQPYTHILMHSHDLQLDSPSWPARHLPFPAELWMKNEAGDGWAPGWAAGVCPLWTDTPRWRGGGAESCSDKRPRIPHCQGQGDLPNCTGTERLLQGQKGKGRHPLVGDVNLLRSLFARIHLDLLAVQGTHKNLLQYHSSKASVLWCSAFLIVQLSHPYMTGKAIALTRWNFVGKVMSLLFNMLSRFIIAFLPSSKHLLIHGYSHHLW